MSPKTYDAIVIGGGHNGLAAAATLARKGKSVCVIEQNDSCGGMARNAAFASGAQAPQIAHLLYNLNPKVAKELGIGTSKAPLLTKELPTVSLKEDGDHVVIHGTKARLASGAIHPEAATYEELISRLIRFAALLGQLSTKSPPSLDGGLTDLATLGELAGLAKLGLDLKRMGKKEMREFLRVILSNIYDLTLDELADDALAGAMTADAVRGAYAGPRSPGTVFSLMYRLGQGGGTQLPIGGMGAVSRAFEQAARAAGVDILTGKGVTRVLVEEDRAAGVALSDGEVLKARAVLSNAGPKATMMLAGAEHYDVEAVRRMRNQRCKGTAAKVNLLLKSAPVFPGLSAELTAGRLLIAPSATYVERAFNPAKYGELPSDPVIELVIPSLTDPSLATDNQHILSAVVSFVPHGLEGGWDKSAQDRLVALTLGTLEKYSPGISDLVLEQQVMSPADIEAATGAPGGHWHHAEMGIDQILTVRPANGMAHYRFGPVGYYLCGAGAHPGGDVTGVAGRNSALQLLKDGVL
ncbi:NAD(P)/FAD-dependent oxidoreductase (plasmid) [Parasedimentitalea marina]|uniref:Pyridine nucleotide-disulfide oxidoreductase domain-containing protein 2 n=1 Tax=Parasedimentitalea marina TaxID=2483033 RepID=A0A3T0NAD2_9RHOB|nr:NAD(P)/FAD-dependent oxidoreductase [Parasedimentitalea marina]AZV80963.1 NAD(P)/FAD-dependent oxidoreductase [Parasedimentitalea marina]